MARIHDAAWSALRAFAESPRHDTHLANAHFVGLYSVVLGRRPDGTLLRAYAVRPGEMPGALLDRDGAFIHHAHAYDFECAPVTGTVVNRVFAQSPNGDPFYAYRFRSGVVGGRATLSRVGDARLAETGAAVVRPGAAYFLRHTEVHRVEFLPDERSGWFGCVVNELARAPRPALAYARQVLDDVPDAEQLYRPVGADEAARLVADLLGGAS